MIAGLDPEQIGEMPLGEITYSNHFFARHALGEVEVGGRSLHLAADLPLRRCTAQALFMANMRQILYMIDTSPDMERYAPSFVGAVAAGKDRFYWAGAVLTEDLTEGGNHALVPRRPSEELIKKGVRLAIVGEGPLVLVTSSPAGQEKIVSFFPEPFRITPGERGSFDEPVHDNQERLTVSIADGSPLANGIAGYRRRAV